jgi:hypothetical protein
LQEVAPLPFKRLKVWISGPWEGAAHNSLLRKILNAHLGVKFETIEVFSQKLQKGKYIAEGPILFTRDAKGQWIQP